MFRFSALLICFFISPYLYAAEYSYRLMAKNLAIPWGMAFVDKQTLLVTERSGKIKRVDLSNGNTSTLLSVPTLYSGGQGGVLDIAVSPTDPKRLYVTYSKKNNSGVVTALASALYKDGKLSKWKDVFVSDSATDTGRHFGSRIAFDSENHLYFSIGDRGVRPNGQDTSNHAGSILRLNLDGSVPLNNPFVDNPRFRDEIWSYGHRNPQGLFFDNVTGNLWSIEHGPRGGDEVNLIKKGANYGWPITSHGKEYWGPVKVAKYEEKEGIESPKKVYIPSIAPSNIILYRGDKYPKLSGKLLAGALKLTHINILTLDKELNIVKEERIFEELKQRIRDIKISPDGYIYFSTDNGNIYRLIKR